MKRLALLLPLLAGCIDFGSELNTRLAMLDGGGISDAGTPDAGTPDAGTPDAGPGCPGPSPCLVANVKTGSTVRGLAPLPDGTFIGVVITAVHDEAGNLLSSSGGLVGAIDGGAYRPLSLPRVPYGDGDAGNTDTITWPVGLALHGSTIAVSDYNGYATLIDLPTRTVVASTATCGFPEFQSYYQAAWFDADTAYFAASNLAGSGGSHLCKWNRTAGFTPVDVAAELDAGSGYTFQTVAVIDGEVFAGDDNGNLYTTYNAAMNAPKVWASSSVQIEWSSISGTSVDQTWASGVKFFSSEGALAKFDPMTSTWTEQPTPPAMNVSGDLGLWQVLVVAPSDLWLVGSFGNVLHSTGDGNWDTVVLPGVDATTTVWSVASHGPKDLAVGVQHDLPDGGAQGELLVYTRP